MFRGDWRGRETNHNDVWRRVLPTPEGVTAMIDRIELRGLRLVTVIGTLDHERQSPQPLELDLVLHVDLTDACSNDELADTVHYGEVTDLVEKIASQEHNYLLERLAGRIAEAILEQPRVEEVEVSVRKLRPPIPSDLATAGVVIMRSRAGAVALDAGHHRAVLALGSNLGDRAGFLRFGFRHAGFVVAQSQVFQTAPVGGPDGQGAFLNMVVAVDTPLDPYALMRRCQRIEAAAGRDRKVHWGPRTLDIDVLFYDDIRIDSPDLVVPHPRINDRRFVLAPLAEVAADRVPPGWDRRLAPEDIKPMGHLDGL